MALLNENLVVETTMNRRVPRGNNGGFGSSSSSPHVDAEAGRFDNTSDITQRIINSPTYQNAYKLFSSLNDKQWLNQLLLIPSAFSDPRDTFLDDLTGSYQDTINNMYQDAMNQIQQLVANYYSYVNSLPSTQVQQFSDAGINSAVTGQGISGSQVPNTVASPSTQHQSTDVVQTLGSALGTAVNFIMTPVNGFADLAVKFRQLKQTDRSLQFNENHALLEFYKYATENGYTVDTNILNGTFGDLFKYGGFANPKGERVNSEEVLKGFLSHHVNSPLFAGLAQLYPDIVSTFNIEGYPGSFTNTGFGSVPVGLSTVVKSQLEMYRNEETWRLRLAKYQSDISKFDASSAEFNSLQAQYNSEYQRYLKEKQRITQDLIERLSKSQNEDDMLLLSKILLGYNYDDIDILNATADGAEVRQFTGAIGDIFGGSASYVNVAK